MTKAVGNLYNPSITRNLKPIPKDANVSIPFVWGLVGVVDHISKVLLEIQGYFSMTFSTNSTKLSEQQFLSIWFPTSHPIPILYCQ
ncbi:MAG: hypothetical protein DM484_16255 [Candidatus Methylumidiphilus alinenensis]|uniref:Uncharacterized protein n=1 Tax=Candidatus Methylumidiphilus alinenensis TaxID=2202197 RepID=A0A2W4QZB2_9GAMM|nr:MAG: hypothetical protein DM484_16255 [Candidatus Methylumidiphilus alinenensis]